MTVVATRLKMEMIFFIKFYHPSNVTPEQNFRVPFIQPSRCEFKIYPHATKHALIFRNDTCSATLDGDRSFPLQTVGWTLQREGIYTHSGITCYLHNHGSFPEYVWKFRVHKFQKL